MLKASVRVLNIFLFLVFLSLQPGGSSQATDLNDVWTNAGVNFEFARENFLTDEVCAKSFNNFIGCIDALNVILSRQEKSLSVLPNNYQAKKNQTKTQDLGWLQLVHWDEKTLNQVTSDDKSTSSMAGQWASQREELLAIDKHWEQLYPKFSAGEPNYTLEPVIVQATSGLKPTEVGMVIGNAYNVFLQSSRDPHTYIIPAEEMDKGRQGGQELIGIGVSIKLNRKGLVVDNVIEGGGADQAGVQRYDIITHVEGVATKDKNINEVVSKIIGEEGTSVRLRLLRGKSEEFEITAVRKKVFFQNVTSRNLSSPFAQDRGYKYVRVNSFMPGSSCNDFGRALFEGVKEGASGYIVDLRGNGGGDLEQVACMLSYFFRPGQTVITMNNPETNEILGAVKTGRAGFSISQPLVVLVDSSSASASEIFAGMVQDFNRGLVVGLTSFGKGTAQSLYPLKEFDNKLIMAETIGRFHFASGWTNQLVGVEPEFQAHHLIDPTEDELFFPREADQYRRPILGFKQNGPATHPQLTQVKSCVESQGKATQAYETNYDYAFSLSLDVVACLNRAN